MAAESGTPKAVLTSTHEPARAAQYAVDVIGQSRVLHIEGTAPGLIRCAGGGGLRFEVRFVIGTTGVSLVGDLLGGDPKVYLKFFKDLLALLRKEDSAAWLSITDGVRSGD